MPVQGTKTEPSKVSDAPGDVRKPLDEVWFLTDRAIGDPNDDAFDHDQVAGQLVEMINTIKPPATLATLRPARDQVGGRRLSGPE